MKSFESEVRKAADESLATAFVIAGKFGLGLGLFIGFVYLCYAVLAI